MPIKRSTKTESAKTATKATVRKTVTETTRESSLRPGETQRPNGTYAYNWIDDDCKRHFKYAKTLKELRQIEQEIEIARNSELNPDADKITLNEVFDAWSKLKKGLRDNTYQNYLYLYNHFVRHAIGYKKLNTIRKSTIKQFYNTLFDNDGLRVSTIDSIQMVLHQVFDFAIDEQYIKINPADNVMKEFKQIYCATKEKRCGLTVDEQNLFLTYLKKTQMYQHWYPIFAIMIGTGMRVGEITGLRWCDVNFEDNLIDVNHTLVYYARQLSNDNNRKNYFDVHAPKTRSSIRQIPMLGFVKDAFLMQKQYLTDNKIECEVAIKGYTDFIFLNRFGEFLHQGTLNKALRRIIRDCNYSVLDKHPNSTNVLPQFSCHSLRHTFSTRMVESGVNLKVVQDILGHSDISTTMNIYTDATKDFKKQEILNLDGKYENDIFKA